MGFDVTKFTQAKFSARSEKFEVQGLSEFFPEGEEPLVTLRGLTAEELAVSDQRADNAGSMAALLESVLATSVKDKVQGIRGLLGLGTDTPRAHVKRLALIQFGMTDPALSESDIVRLGDAFPIEFYQISNRIVELTGQGKILGKAQGSISTPELESR